MTLLFLLMHITSTLSATHPSSITVSCNLYIPRFEENFSSYEKCKRMRFDEKRD